MHLASQSRAVVELRDVLRSDNHVWIVLERCGGGDFLDVLSRESLDESRVRRYARQLLQAVKHCHDRDVCHLDISVENILLGDDDCLKLADFGVRTFIDITINYCSFTFCQLAHRVDSSGAVVRPALPDNAKPGKPAFMAPEVFRGLRPFNARKSDLYSIGITLFVLLFRRMPYKQPLPDDRDFSLVYDGGVGGLRAWMEKQQGDCQCSELALDFLGALICPPQRRLEARDAIGHPWLTPAEPAHRASAQ